MLVYNLIWGGTKWFVKYFDCLQALYVEVYGRKKFRRGSVST